MSASALRRLLVGGAAALCFTLGACSDPYLREGTWHATGVNNDNLRAMLANTGDLKWGASAPGNDGQLAAAALTRWRTGQLKSLATDSIAKIGSGGGASAQPASASPGTGGN